MKKFNLKHMINQMLILYFNYILKIVALEDNDPEDLNCWTDLYVAALDGRYVPVANAT